MCQRDNNPTRDCISLHEVQMYNIYHHCHWPPA